jgi:hypothetical protein
MSKNGKKNLDLKHNAVFCLSNVLRDLNCSSLIFIGNACNAKIYKTIFCKLCTKIFFYILSIFFTKYYRHNQNYLKFMICTERDCVCCRILLFVDLQGVYCYLQHCCNYNTSNLVRPFIPLHF